MAPRATYRLQLQPDFTLHDVIRVVPYLARLGVSHVYLSPITQATAGSDHGYDVTDPTRVADALGGEHGLRALVDALHTHDMGVLLDIVPNHMAASSENAWWADLLEHGAASEHVATFDTPLSARGSTRLCLPVLGAPLEDIVARGELRVARHAGRPVLRYHDHWFPIPAAVAYAADHVRGDDGSLRQLLDTL
ncbi:MAG: alpha-amylase family glycosyl hydrolase, partial [Longimicrobiales bacterium]